MIICEVDTEAAPRKQEQRELDTPGSILHMNPADASVPPVLARLILGFLFFAICLGLGYPGVSRYDPTQVQGLRDTQRYVAMLDGTAGWKTQQELRVLVPFLARPFYRASIGRVGTWQPEFFALLVVNSVFVAWAAVLLVGIGERVTGSYVTGLTASFLYLLSFNVANIQLAGLVDSVEAWALIALTWALVKKRWVLIPLIGVVGALGKETSSPLAYVFCAAWFCDSRSPNRHHVRCISALRRCWSCKWQRSCSFVQL